MKLSFVLASLLLSSAAISGTVSVADAKDISSAQGTTEAVTDNGFRWICSIVGVCD